ncbi:ead/Ea22-like family protein [Escherichia coli]|uniref:ead/Ea22-like family protein n=1 Tax=Escherichia coli TaxID=562 RepID=UPI0016AA25BA|nr:ead/Ea22-like family protein [Escherichia coli]EFG5708487.1 ead/Ea22-like family protein [Escherichia coli]EFG8914516.1 ead/Ea22-like family protein [Escherichia coli]EFJ9646064.1 ead/Ea22-like family protein [Escherichia coli]EFK2271072.1 ead/Ea22-like family protein [Escherichia coli]EFK2786062.1 ead/Ea22-like family protein [Escherichia coli]
MSKIDYQALREAAEKATCGEWSLEYGEGRFDGDDALIHREAAGYIPICRIEGAHPESGFDEDFQMEQQANAEFIAAASPATVLALLDELEAAEKRIAELEGGAFNPAILDVVAERQRQQSVEGWTPEHDNAYQNSELADAAACYAIHAHNQGFSTPAHWPWSPDWWKQSGARRDLVKAGALILAEIERIDRAAGIGVKGE